MQWIPFGLTWLEVLPTGPLPIRIPGVVRQHKRRRSQGRLPNPSRADLANEELGFTELPWQVCGLRDVCLRAIKKWTLSNFGVFVGDLLAIPIFAIAISSFRSRNYKSSNYPPNLWQAGRRRQAG
jgi:hypothetical protein